MQRNRIPILCTRPMNPRLIVTAEEKGFQVDIIPFIKTEFLESHELASRIQHFSTQSITVVFTSMNAAESVISKLNGRKPVWKIFCIGNTTRHTLIKYFGEAQIAGFSNTASALAHTVVETGNFSEIIFFCGDQRREELPSILASNNIHVEEIIVYKTMAINNKIDRHYQGVLFFSPSAVTSFFQPIPWTSKRFYLLLAKQLPKLYGLTALIPLLPVKRPAKKIY